MSTQHCTAVSPACPVKATTYGYVPDLSANITLLVIFAICTVLQLGLGTFYRAWSFMVALGIGCAMEFIGYIGRILMHKNVWNKGAFEQQIVCLILAPSFIAAGVYLSLKHIILYLGPEHSRLKPKLYTWIFIGCDIFSIFVQAAGGGIAAAAGDTDVNLLNAGNDMMIAGIAFQVVTMVICALLAVDFAIRYHRSGVRATASWSSKSEFGTERSGISHVRFQIFCVAEVFAFVTVLTRCIYRIPEMAGGWGNPLMQNETEFLFLDGMMVALASVTFTVFHPGFWFPPMTGRWKRQTNSAKQRNSDTLDSKPE